MRPGQAVVHKDPVLRHAQAQEGLALNGEVLLDGGDPGVLDLLPGHASSDVQKGSVRAPPVNESSGHQPHPVSRQSTARPGLVPVKVHSCGRPARMSLTVGVRPTGRTRSGDRMHGDHICGRSAMNKLVSALSREQFS